MFLVPILQNTVSKSENFWILRRLTVLERDGCCNAEMISPSPARRVLDALLVSRENLRKYRYIEARL
jgi:hypothetical protein